MPKLHDWLKQTMVPVMTAAMALGMLAMLCAKSLLLIHMASFFIGFAYSVIMPYVVANLTRSSPGLNHTVTSSLFVAANGIGASVSAVALDRLSSLFGLTGSSGQIQVGVGFAAILCICTVFYIIANGKRLKGVA